MNEIQNSLKYILCELLNDDAVQENIVNIVKKAKQQTEHFEQNIENLEKQKNDLFYELQQMQNEYEILQLDYQNLEREKEEIQYEKDKIYQQFQNYRKEYEPLQDIKKFWQGALQLEVNQKSYLKKLCGEWDIKSLIALGKDKNSIKQLWNFIRDEIMNSSGNRQNIKTLSAFFDLCIDVYNITNIRKERYEKIEVLIGSEYNSRQYIKTSESVVNGIVKEVVLNGYTMRNDVMKPIVIVE
ncbi:hypothetical protein AAK894_06835 [Lachnospiraceae bacterium 46-61]